MGDYEIRAPFWGIRLVLNLLFEAAGEEASLCNPGVPPQKIQRDGEQKQFKTLLEMKNSLIHKFI